MKDILTPPDWSKGKRAKFIDWLNKELAAEEGRKLLKGEEYK